MPSLRVLGHAFRAWRRNLQWSKHEPETPYLADLLSGAPVCLHVGASDGRHSYVMTQVAPKARIFALEPSAFSYAVLKTTVAWHRIGDQVTPVHAAAGDRPGELLLGALTGSSASGASAGKSRLKSIGPEPLPASVLSHKRDTPAAPADAVLWLVGFDDRHETPVRRGENAGRTLVDRNVVRSLARLDGWSPGGTITAAKPEGDRTAVLLQAADGRILGAARL